MTQVCYVFIPGLWPRHIVQDVFHKSLLGRVNAAKRRNRFVESEFKRVQPQEHTFRSRRKLGIAFDIYGVGAEQYTFVL